MCDAAGNCSTAGPVTANQIDRLAPSITLTTPATGTSYTQGQVVNAGYACSDAASGVAMCTGTVLNASPIDTSGSGTKTFTVTSTDGAGNAATPVTVSYTVTATSGSISGTVTNQTSGRPVAGTNVRAYLDGTNALAGATQTDSSGRYLLTLPNGRYRVQFANGGGYLSAFYANTRGYRDAAVVTVNGEAITADQALVPTPTVSGTVTDRATGVPVAGARVIVYNHAGVYNGTKGITDRLGHYTFNALPAGTYQVKFAKLGAYATKWHAGSTSRGGATNVVLASDGSGVVNASLTHL